MALERLLVVFALSMPMTACGQSLVEQAENDELYMAAEGDAHMEAAYRQAKEGLDAFLASWRNPPPGYTEFAVKVGVVEGGSTEYFWLSPFREHAGAFIGTINNEPRMVTSVKLGQEIDFRKEEIVDWLYDDRGRMVGNFTACAMLEAEPERERRAFEQRFGLRCGG